MAPGERAEAAQAFAISSHWVLLLGPTESLAGNYEKAVRQQLELAALAVTDYQDFAWLRHDVEQPPTFLRMYTNPLSNVPLLDCQIASPVSLSVQEFAQLTGTEAAKSLDWAGGSLTHFKTGADVGPKSVMMITPDPAIFASVGISNVAAFLEIPYAAVGN